MRVIEVIVNVSTTISTDFVRLFYDYYHGLLRLDDYSGKTLGACFWIKKGRAMLLAPNKKDFFPIY
jgi:hypothetical protein